MWASVDKNRVEQIVIVGDAFAKPILAEFEVEPARYDLSSMRVIISSGVMLSADSKQRLLGHIPRLILIDSLGASEAVAQDAENHPAQGPPDHEDHGGVTGLLGDRGIARSAAQ